MFIFYFFILFFSNSCSLFERDFDFIITFIFIFWGNQSIGAKYAFNFILYCCITKDEPFFKKKKNIICITILVLFCNIIQELPGSQVTEINSLLVYSIIIGLFKELLIWIEFTALLESRECHPMPGSHTNLEDHSFLYSYQSLWL